MQTVSTIVHGCVCATDTYISALALMMETHACVSLTRHVRQFRSALPDTGTGAWAIDEIRKPPDSPTSLEKSPTNVAPAARP